VQIAPSHRGRVDFVVRGAAPGSAAETTSSVRARVHRRPLAPFPVPRDVSARRVGSDVVVTWRTAHPQGRVFFFVEGRRRRREVSGKGARVVRSGRRYEARIRNARSVRWVAVEAHETVPPLRERTVIVRVS
jgi:hypothetical protein